MDYHHTGSTNNKMLSLNLISVGSTLNGHELKLFLQFRCNKANTRIINRGRDTKNANKYQHQGQNISRSSSFLHLPILMTWKNEPLSKIPSRTTTSYFKSRDWKLMSWHVLINHSFILWIWNSVSAWLVGLLNPLFLAFTF